MNTPRYGNSKGVGKMKTIDFHTHPQWDQPFKQMAEVLRVADIAGVAKLVVLGANCGFGFDPTEPQTRVINDLTLRLIRRWPHRLIGFCRLCAGNSVSFNLREIDRCFATGYFSGIKLAVWPNARSRKLDHIMRQAEQLRAVVLHHCWYKTVCKYRGESDPTDIADLAARFPKVNLVMAHLTAAGIKGVQDIRPYPNIYPDTSGSQGFSEIVEYAVEHLGAERILFGSDIPGRDFSVQLGRIYGANITDKQKRMILYQNAEKLFGLS